MPSGHMHLLGALNELNARLNAAESAPDSRETLEYFMNDAIDALVNKRIYLQKQQKASDELRGMEQEAFRIHQEMISDLKKEIERQEEGISGYAAQIRELITVEPRSAEGVIYGRTESNRQAGVNIEKFSDVKTRRVQINRNRVEMFQNFKNKIPDKRDKRRVFWGMKGDDRMDMLMRLYPDLTSTDESIARSAQIKVNDFFKDQLDP
jgi:vacuolar-type H+-ATPase subunit H